MTETRVVVATRDIAAPAQRIFDLIADPARQPAWDGNDNLDHAEAGQRVTAVGQVFAMHNTGGAVRANHVVAFEEARLIAWRPGEEGGEPFGQEWRWELESLDDAHTRVTHTYDWTELSTPQRFERARATTTERLAASLDRLASLAEG